MATKREVDDFAGRRMWVKSRRAAGDTSSLLREWRFMRVEKKLEWQRKAEAELQTAGG